MLGRWRLRGWVGDAAAPDSCQLSALLLVLRVAQRQCREMKSREGRKVCDSSAVSEMIALYC